MASISSASVQSSMSRKTWVNVLQVTGCLQFQQNYLQNLLVQFQNNYQRWYNLKQILHILLHILLHITHKVYVDETNHFKYTRIGSINQFIYKDFNYVTWCSYTQLKKRRKMEWIWTKTGHEYVHTKQYCNLVCYITLRDGNFIWCDKTTE